MFFKIVLKLLSKIFIFTSCELRKQAEQINFQSQIFYVPGIYSACPHQQRVMPILQDQIIRLPA
jgi:hypothetical protein